MKLAVLLLVGCAAHGMPLENTGHTTVSPSREDFPLEPGTRWVYAGTTEDEQGTHPARQVAEVRRAVTRGTVTIALVSHLPGFGEQSVVVRDDGRVWVLDEKDAPQGDALPPGPPTFTFPVTLGKVACDDPADEPPMYCTMIEKTDDGRFMRIYRTHPDDTEIFFAPGIGITGYGYHHHGTTNSTDLKLVEKTP